MEKTLGSFLAEKRKDKNLTQKQLAEKLFVSESAISKWEKDVAHPDITVLPKLSEILGVTEHEHIRRQRVHIIVTERNLFILFPP